MADRAPTPLAQRNRRPCTRAYVIAVVYASDADLPVSDLVDWAAAMGDLDRTFTRAVIRELIADGLLEDLGKRPTGRRGPAPTWVRLKGGHA